MYVLFFSFLLKNIACGYSLEPPRFEQKYENIRIFYLKIFHFLVVKFSVYLNRHVFVMSRTAHPTEPPRPDRNKTPNNCFFAFRVDPLFKFSDGTWCTGKETGSHKNCLHCRKCKKINMIKFSLFLPTKAKV